MNRFPPSTNLDPPKLTPDTLVEITSTGDLETVDAAQQPQTSKLDDIVAKATVGIRDTYADPAKLTEYLKHDATVGEITDAKLGTNDSMVAIAQPAGSEKVEEAAEVTLAHKDVLIAAAPALRTQVDWNQTRDDVARLHTVSKVKARLQVRVDNLTALEAHLRTRIAGNLTLVNQQAGPVIENNRSLKASMSAFNAFFHGAAEQAAVTKRAVAKALKKKDVKKGKAAAKGDDTAAAKDAAATPGKDPAPQKDGR